MSRSGPLTSGPLTVDDLMVEVTVRRVRRMNIRVHPPHGDVRLSVPPRTSQRAVVRFVRESRAWIEHHRHRIAEEERRAAARPTVAPATGRSGELWWHLGRPHRLVREVVPGRPSVQVGPDGRIVVRAPLLEGDPDVLALLDRWRRRELRRVAGPLLDEWGGRLGVQHRFLGIRRMTTRWGSCVPSEGRIWLSLALVERPPTLLEYVIVHELAHLREASHGPRFRALMDQHLPDWERRRRELDATA